MCPPDDCGGFVPPLHEPVPLSAETPEPAPAAEPAAEPAAPAPAGRCASATPRLPVPRPRRPTRVDWAQIVRLVAEGRPVAEVASIAGCGRQHVWQVLRRARRPSAADSAALVAEMNLRLSALRIDVVEGLARAVAADDARVTLWLAERLRVGADEAARAGRCDADRWGDPRLSPR